MTVKRRAETKFLNSYKLNHSLLLRSQQVAKLASLNIALNTTVRMRDGLQDRRKCVVVVVVHKQSASPGVTVNQEYYLEVLDSLSGSFQLHRDNAPQTQFRQASTGALFNRFVILCFLVIPKINSTVT
jgi:hypothetical protein